MEEQEWNQEGKQSESDDIQHQQIKQEYDSYREVGIEEGRQQLDNIRIQLDLERRRLEEKRRQIELEKEKLSSKDSKPGSQAGSSGSLCVVCGEKATGMHYMAFTCEGCKIFFRRKSKKHATLRCTNLDNQGQCDVVNKSRRFCSACRFQKCLDVGMNIGRIWDTDRLKSRKPAKTKQHSSEKEELHEASQSTAPAPGDDSGYNVVSSSLGAPGAGAGIGSRTDADASSRTDADAKSRTSASAGAEASTDHASAIASPGAANPPCLAGAGASFGAATPPCVAGAVASLDAANPLRVAGAAASLGAANPLCVAGAGASLSSANPLCVAGAVASLGAANPLHVASAGASLGAANPLHVAGAGASLGAANPLHVAGAGASLGAANPLRVAGAGASPGAAHPQFVAGAGASPGAANPPYQQMKEFSDAHKQLIHYISTAFQNSERSIVFDSSKGSFKELRQTHQMKKSGSAQEMATGQQFATDSSTASSSMPNPFSSLWSDMDSGTQPPDMGHAVKMDLPTSGMMASGKLAAASVPMASKAAEKEDAPIDLSVPECEVGASTASTFGGGMPAEFDFDSDMSKFMMELLMHDLKRMIAFVKALPIYQKLPMTEQATFVKETFPDFMAWVGSKRFKPETNQFYNEVTEEEYFLSDLCLGGAATFMLNFALPYCNNLAKLKFTKEESHLFCALCLLNPDRKTFSDLIKQTIAPYYTSIVEVLCASGRVNHADEPLWFSQMMSHMAYTRKCSDMFKGFLIQLQLQGHSILPLLGEVMDV